MTTAFRCINFGRCPAADAGELLSSADAPNGRCARCGEPVSPVKDTRAAWWKGALAAAVFLAAALALAASVAKRRAASAGPARSRPIGTFENDRGGATGPRPEVIFTDGPTVALTRAALAGDSAGVRTAIAAGAHVNAQGRSGLTPLHLTLLHLKPEGFRCLLENGADPNLKAENGDSAMALAAIVPDASWLEMALTHGGAVDQRDARERSPLMLAARRERPANVRLLLAHGADPNARDQAGATALTHVFQALHPSAEIARELLAHGARLDLKDTAGFTARQYAATHQDPTLMSLFPTEAP